MTKTTTIRMKSEIREDLKQTCEHANVSMSKTIQTLIALFLNDYALQERVLREVRTK